MNLALVLPLTKIDALMDQAFSPAAVRAEIARIDAAHPNPLDAALEKARLLACIAKRPHYVGKPSGEKAWTVAAAMLEEWQGSGYEVRARGVWRLSPGPRVELFR